MFLPKTETKIDCGDRDRNCYDPAACSNAKKEASIDASAKSSAVVATAAASSSTTERAPSFYQRKLPETCVAFDSFEGKQIFKSALEHRGLKSFFNLIQQHHTQTEPAFCGVSTLVLVLNALAVDPGQNWKGPWRWYEEKMLNCCVDLEEIKHVGITLQDFQCLSFCQGLSVDLNYCDETSSLEDFRKAVERACLEDDENDDHSEEDGNKILECLVVSYSRKILKQTGDGHFSPLAAYDKESDSVLILDTARFKYGAHWTKLPLIYEAMKPIDKTTGKSRGYALLSFVPELAANSNTNTNINVNVNTNTVVSTPSETGSGSGSSNNTLISTSKMSTQPASILYRSMMNQRRKRKSYKEYIRSLREKNDHYKDDNGEGIPYEVVRAYWCEGGDRPSCVWEIIVPTRVRTEEEKEMLRKMRLLLVDLHHATIRKSKHGGGGGTDGRDTLASESGSNINNNSNDNNTIPSDSGGSTSRCRTCETYNPSTNHTSSVSVEETLYIIYLATLSEKKRYDFVMNFDSPQATDVVRKQIIKEADMIASAIEVSDQLTSL